MRRHGAAELSVVLLAARPVRSRASALLWAWGLRLSSLWALCLPRELTMALLRE